MFSAYPQCVQDVGDFVSSVEHKQRFCLIATASGTWRVNVLWHIDILYMYVDTYIDPYISRPIETVANEASM